MSGRKGNKDASGPRESAEKYFLRLYNASPVTGDILKKSVDEARDSISRILVVPRNAVVSNYESFTRAPFTWSAKDRECAPFYDACVRVTGFISLLSGAIRRGEHLSSQSGSVRGALCDDWSNCGHCPEMQKILRAAFGICMDDDDFVVNNFTGEVLEFLGSVVLCCSSVCQSIVFQHILECVGHVFTLESISRFSLRVRGLLDSEVRSSKSGQRSDGSFQSFLRLVSCISRFRIRDDYAIRFMEDGNDFLHSASDFISTDMFCTFLGTLSSLCRNSTLAESIYRRLDESISEIVSLRNCLQGIKSHAEDFSHDTGGCVLNSESVQGLQSVLGLIESLCRESPVCVERFAKKCDFDLIHSILVLIHSGVSVTLKAKCFDCLSSFSTDSEVCARLWSEICNSPILDCDVIESGVGGILVDINGLECRERTYPLTQSFIHFLSRLLSGCESFDYDFTLYHRFLFEFILLKLRQRHMLHFHERWSILSKLCQCWTNLLCHTRQRQCLLRSAFCDSRFTDILVEYCCEDDVPEETLFCIFRLFLRLCEIEDDFRENMDIGDGSCYVSTSQRLAWSRVLQRLINCISSRDHDLQIVSIYLSQRIGSRSKDIAQVIFSDRRCKPISIFKKCLSVDEEEVDGELNVRNSILSVLVSFGGSSYFVRHVCGYDQSNVPASLVRSTLDKGILSVLLEKINDEKSLGYVKFRDLFFELVRVLCDNELTRPGVLNLLRSSHDFFKNQLQHLQRQNCLLSTVGSFVHILSFEAFDSDSSSSNVTESTFECLFGNQGFSASRTRVVLACDLINRIESGRGGFRVCRDFLYCVVRYMRNSCIKKVIESRRDEWRPIWVDLLKNVLELCGRLHDPPSLKVLCDLAAFIGGFLVRDGFCGKLDSGETGIILRSCLVSLSRLVDLNITRARLGIYSILGSLECSGFSNIFVMYEPIFVRCALTDLNSPEPIMICSVVSACSRLHVIGSRALRPVLSRLIDQFGTLWYLFEMDARGGIFALDSVLNFIKEVLHGGDEYLIGLLSSGSILGHICHDSFWHHVFGWFHGSSRYDLNNDMLRTACNFLDVIISLNMVFCDSDDIRHFTVRFFSRYEDVFRSVCNCESHISICALEFLEKLVSIYSLFSFIEDAQGCVQCLRDRVSSEGFRDLIRDKKLGDSESDDEDSMRTIDELLSSMKVYFNMSK